MLLQSFLRNQREPWVKGPLYDRSPCLYFTDTSEVVQIPSTLRDSSVGGTGKLGMKHPLRAH